MGPKGRRVGMIEFELNDMAADMHWRREEREAREIEEGAQNQREKARREETTHSSEEGEAEKHARTNRSDTEMDTCTEGGGEEGTSHLHSRQKKGHMINIYLTDSDEEAIVDFVKDHEELYDKTNEHFKGDIHQESQAVKVFKSWFESQRTPYGKLTQSKSGQALK